MSSFEDFMKLDIRVGTIIEASINDKAIKKAYKLKIDFGSDIGIKISSAQITDNYELDDLINKQVVAVVNFPSKQVAGVISEVLVLGVYTSSGVVLLGVDKKVDNGCKVG